MTTLVAILVVGAGSLAFRLVPLVLASQLTEHATRIATWAGLSALVAVTVRGVLQQDDASVPAPTLVAAISVGLALVLAARGRSIITVLVVGAVSHVVLTAALGSVA